MYENEHYDLEWTWPYTDNYTGPNWSNGKWQASVANGNEKPKSRLDSYSRDHDTSYALCPDDADMLYYRRTRGMSFVPSFIGSLPIGVNPSVRRVYRFFSGEKYSNMAAQGIPGNLRGHDFGGEDPKNYKVGAVLNNSKFDKAGEVVQMAPDKISRYSKTPVYTGKPQSTPSSVYYPVDAPKTVPLELPQHGGNDQGIRRANFFFDHRGAKEGGFLHRWKRNNRKRIKRIHVDY